jgi:hypothetical protein
MQIERVRLMRAVHLDCEPVGHGRVFRVWGGAEGHTVDWDRDHCDCRDHPRYICKHRLRVGLALGEPTVLRALCRIVPNPDRARRRRALAA